MTEQWWMPDKDRVWHRIDPDNLGKLDPKDQIAYCDKVMAYGPLTHDTELRRTPGGLRCQVCVREAPADD